MGLQIARLQGTYFIGDDLFWCNHYKTWLSLTHGWEGMTTIPAILIPKELQLAEGEGPVNVRLESDQKNGVLDYDPSWSGSMINHAKDEGSWD